MKILRHHMIPCPPARWAAKTSACLTSNRWAGRALGSFACVSSGKTFGGSERAVTSENALAERREIAGLTPARVGNDAMAESNTARDFGASRSYGLRLTAAPSPRCSVSSNFFEGSENADTSGNARKCHGSNPYTAFGFGAFHAVLRTPPSVAPSLLRSVSFNQFYGQ